MKHKIEEMKEMMGQLISCTKGEMSNLSEADAHEMGEAIDMIKDLSEGIYYCTITEAMNKSEQSKEGQEVRTVNYYTAPMYAGGRYDDRWNGPYMNKGIDRMYYPTGRNGETTYGGNMDGVGMFGNVGRVVTHYTDTADMMRDPRQGRSPMRRRMYMEGKEAHHDTNSQLRELEAYLQELSTDITEMIKDASPEERATLHQKMTTLANKMV